MFCRVPDAVNDDGLSDIEFRFDFVVCVPFIAVDALTAGVTITPEKSSDIEWRFDFVAGRVPFIILFLDVVIAPDAPIRADSSGIGFRFDFVV